MATWTGAAGGTSWTFLRHTHLGFSDDVVISNWSTTPNIPQDGDSIAIGSGVSVTGGGGSFSSLSLGANGSLTPGNITVSNGVSNAGTLTFASASLNVTGAVSNSGLIVLVGRGDITFPDGNLGITGSVTASGGGTIRLALSTLGSGGISPTAAGATFINADNAIEGAGRIAGSVSQLSFRNYGVVNANVAASAITIATQSRGVLNNGTIEATGGGSLIFDTEVVDGSGGGTLQALGGSHIELYGTTLRGSLATTGSGYVNLLRGPNGEPVTFDGRTAAFTTSATIVTTSIDANRGYGSIYLEGSVRNTGSMTIATSVDVDALGATLTGGGAITLAGGSIDVRSGQSSGVLTNVDNMISGYGQAIGYGLTLVNQGTINASDATNTLKLGGYGTVSVQNAGLIEATGAGGLAIAAMVSNAGHSIVVGAGSKAELNGSTIQGGTLTSTGSGYFSVAGYPGAVTLDGATQGAITSNATIRLGATGLSGTLTASGSFVNNGTVLDMTGGTVNVDGTLSGTGRIVMTGGQLTGSLVDFGNAISGQGTISTTSIDLEAGASINADAAGGTLSTFRTASIVNKGVLEASGGTLQLGGQGLTTIQNTGVIEAISGGKLALSATISNAGRSITVGDGSVAELNGSTIQGGTLTSTDSGYFSVAGFPGNLTLDGATLGVITSNATIRLAATNLSGALTTSGTLVNNGAILDTVGGYINFGGTLTGTGRIVMTGGQIAGSLVDYGNAISGQGTISNTSIDLEAGASINADTAGTTLSITGSQPVINNGVLEASGGTLTVAPAVQGTGTALIKGGGTLSFGSNGFNENVSFQGSAAGTLRLGTSFGGVISGFATGDTVDLTSLGFKASDTLTWTPNGAAGGRLSIFDGRTDVSDLGFAGHYTAASFRLADDGAGRTKLTTIVPVTRSASDFDGDGKSDLVVTNDNGAIDVFTDNGLALSGFAGVGNPGPTWHVLATGDFNGDGQPDLLLQNDSGALVDYLMAGTGVVAANFLGNPGTAWHVRGVGDFNGDGTSDVLLQNDNGAMVDYTLTGGAVTGAGYLGALPAGWAVEGVADFDGNGTPDILAQNVGGSLVVFTTGGGAITGSTSLGNPGAGWSVGGTGDYNGDGTADVLLHNDNGADVAYLLQGGAVASAVFVGNPGAAYGETVAGLDLNGDGASDLVVQNRADGTLIGYTLNNSAVITAGAVLTDPGSTWHALGNNPVYVQDGSLAGTLTGTAGPDQFNETLAGATAGLHMIAGFDPAVDAIALSAAAFPSYAAVQAHEAAYGTGTFIGLSGSSALIIQGVAPGSLSASNFVFR